MKRLTWPDFSTFSRRERLLSFGSLLILSLVLLDRVVLGPWGHHTHHVRQEIERLEVAIRRQQELLNREPKIRAEAEAYREHLRVNDEPIPDMAGVLREIEGLGAQSGVTLGEVKPLEGAAKDTYQEYAIDVQYRGSLEQWIHFVYLLQSSKSLFAIQRATIARKGEDPSQVEGTLRLSSKIIRPHQAAEPHGPLRGTRS